MSIVIKYFRKRSHFKRIFKIKFLYFNFHLNMYWNKQEKVNNLCWKHILWCKGCVSYILFNKHQSVTYNCDLQDILLIGITWSVILAKVFQHKRSFFWIVRGHEDFALLTDIAYMPMSLCNQTLSLSFSLLTLELASVYSCLRTALIIYCFFFK